jgi:hypothetical protein
VASGAPSSLLGSLVTARPAIVVSAIREALCWPSMTGSIVVPLYGLSQNDRVG